MTTFIMMLKEEVPRNDVKDHLLWTNLANRMQVMEVQVLNNQMKTVKILRSEEHKSLTEKKPNLRQNNSISKNSDKWKLGNLDKLKNHSKFLGKWTSMRMMILHIQTHLDTRIVISKINKRIRVKSMFFLCQKLLKKSKKYFFKSFFFKCFLRYQLNFLKLITSCYVNNF